MVVGFYSHQFTCLRFILGLSLVGVPHLGQNLSSSLSSAHTSSSKAFSYL